VDPDPDPAIFLIDLQDANKKLIKKKFFCLLLFDGTITLFFNDKNSDRSHKTIGSKISYYFCLLISGSGAGAGSIPLTNGSGSRRPKNTWIRFRIRNTGREDKKVLL
jgi:hypothetical protein